MYKANQMITFFKPLAFALETTPPFVLLLLACWCPMTVSAFFVLESLLPFAISSCFDAAAAVLVVAATTALGCIVVYSYDKMKEQIIDLHLQKDFFLA